MFSSAQRLEVLIRPDNNAADTYWTLTRPGNQLKGLVPGFRGPTILGPHIFRISDNKGDGICCSNGRGSYELRLDDVAFVLGNGQFGSSETVHFTVSYSPNSVRKYQISNLHIDTTPSPNGPPRPVPVPSTAAPTSPPSATAAPGVPGSAATRYNIQLVPAAGFNPASLPSAVRALEAAARRWETVITGDLPDANGIDDLRITYDFSPIDGRGSTIGQAGPTSFRRGTSLPLTGTMQFDSADIGSQSPAEQEALFLHEMGHVLGIGTLWNQVGLSRCENGNPLYSPSNSNSNARTAYRTSPGRRGTSELLIEQDGGEGTACGHFDEVQLQSEVMTGFLTVNRQTGISELSSITVGTLKDLGYTVNNAVAVPFTIPQSEFNGQAEEGEEGEVKSMDLRGDILKFDFVYVDTDEDRVLREAMPSAESLIVRDDSSFNLGAFAAGAGIVGVFAGIAFVVIRSRKSTSESVETHIQLVDRQ